MALDEWNYWYGPHVFGELGTRYFLRDALGIAAGIHEYYVVFPEHDGPCPTWPLYNRGLP